MANLESSITDIVQGDDCYITRNITSIPLGHHLTDAWISVKENHWDTDVVFSKHVTTSSTSSGFIPDDGSGDTSGIVQFIITAAETNSMEPYYRYTFDIQVKTTNGVITKIYTPEYGDFIVHPAITPDI